MPRTKIPSQKRRRDDAEASSSLGATRYPANMRLEHRTKYIKFMTSKNIRPNMVLDWNVLEKLNLRQQVAQLLQDEAWFHLLSIEEPIYRELVLTFISTFSIKREYEKGLNNEVEFLALGEYRRYSMTEFIRALEIYDPPFLETEEFRRLPLGFPRGYRPGSYWPRIGKGFYNASSTKSSNLSEVSYRVIHYILARSTTGRTDSEGVVNARDMFQLWSMNTRTQVNVGVFAAFCILRQSADKPKGVFVGAWIIRILKNLELFPVRPPTDEVGEIPKLPEAQIVTWIRQARAIEPEDSEEAPAAGGAEEVEVEQPEAATRPAPERVRATRRDDDIRSTLQAIQKEQKKLKQFMKNCFAKIGERFNIDFSGCGGSSEEDVQTGVHTDAPGPSRPPQEQSSDSVSLSE